MKIRSVIILILSIITLLYCFGIIQLFQLNQDTTTGDPIYIESLYRDLFTDGFNVSGWLVSKAPCYFPDLMLFFLIRAIAGDYDLAFYLYMVLDFFFILVFFYFFLKKCWVESTIERLIFTLSWGFVLLLINYFAPWGGPQAIIQPLWHSGAIVNGLITFWLWYPYVYKLRTKLNLLLAFVFTAVSVASDFWWVIWFGLPTGIMILVLIIRNKIEKGSNLKFLCSTGFGVFAGLGFGLLAETNRWLYFSHVPVGTPGQPIKGQILFVINDFIKLFSISPGLWICIPITLILSLYYLLSKKVSERIKLTPFRKINENETILVRVVCLSFIISTLLTLIVVIYLRLWGGSNYRYFHNVFVLAWMISGFYFYDLYVRRGIYKLIIIFSLIAPTILIATPLFESNSTFSRYGPRTAYPTNMACLDKVAESHNLQYGISEYFQAKTIGALTKKGLLVNQVTYDFDILHWVNNFYWYLTKSTPRNLLEYDFIVSLPNQESYKRIPYYFGEPTEINNCGGWQVFIYKGAQKDKLNEIMKLKTIGFFEKLGDQNVFNIPDRENLISDGRFEKWSKTDELNSESIRSNLNSTGSPNADLFIKKWDFLNSGGSAIIKKIPLKDIDKDLINATHCIQWEFITPSAFGYLEQRIVNNNYLPGKKLKLDFWARVLKGREEFFSHMYYLPKGMLDASAIIIRPDDTLPYYLTDKWKRISVAYTIPNVPHTANVDKNQFFLIRPIFFEKSGTPTIEIANIDLVAYDVAVPSNLPTFSLLNKSVDSKSIIEQSDNYFLKKDLNNAFSLLKRVEAFEPNNLSVKWRLGRIYYLFATQAKIKDEVFAFSSLAGVYCYDVEHSDLKQYESEIPDIAKWCQLVDHKLHEGS